jgi:hypothetical protein
MIDVVELPWNARNMDRVIGDQNPKPETVNPKS